MGKATAAQTAQASSAAKTRGWTGGARHSPLTARMVSDLAAIGDAVVVALSGMAAAVFYTSHMSPLAVRFERIEGLSLIAALAFFAIGQRLHAYDLNRLRRFSQEGGAVLYRWSLSILIAFVAMFLFKISDNTSRGWALTWYLSGGATIVLTRILWRQSARALFRNSPALKRRVALIGSTEAAQRICAQMQRDDNSAEVVGVFSENGADEFVTGIGPKGIVGSVDDLFALCRRDLIDDVVITVPWTEDALINDLVHRLRVLPCAVHLCPGALAVKFGTARFGTVGDTPALEVTNRSMEGWASLWKVVQDRLLASATLLFLSPLMLLIALAIKLESPGPVLFRQRRCGFNQRVFNIYKFRTMTVCEDGDIIVQAKKNDARITRVGAILRRYSLDELPQLLNVLIGDMSLVGPRPHALAHDDKYARIIEDYSVRQRVLPGMTGWAQVNGCRGETATPDKMRERVEHDLYYVENWSPFFDIKILVLTFFVVFKGNEPKKRPTFAIVVENLPVPFDRRVWQEACAARDAGWDVSVICPATEAFPKLRETIDGIEVYRHPMPLEANGRGAFLVEYAAALFHEFRLLFHIWRTKGLSVIQACNPPDLIFLVAAPFKLLGTRFVFDHHDICPELYSVKFNNKGLMHRIVTVCERLTFMMADQVISTNETFREIAIARGHKRSDRVTSVYSVPDRAKMHRTSPNSSLRNGRSTVIGYVGIIGHQDGVDHLVQATHHIVRTMGCTDVQTVIVGDGPAASASRQLAKDIGIDEHITFTGYLRNSDLLDALSTFDFAVIPDPQNEYNDKISMNKVFEYSMLGIPIVSVRLTETCRLLGDAALYAEDSSPQALAEQMERLTTDPQLRATLAAMALDRTNTHFDWRLEARKYVSALDRALTNGRRWRASAIVQPIFLTRPEL